MCQVCAKKWQNVFCVRLCPRAAFQDNTLIWLEGFPSAMNLLVLQSLSVHYIEQTCHRNPSDHHEIYLSDSCISLDIIHVSIFLSYIRVTGAFMFFTQSKSSCKEVKWSMCPLSRADSSRRKKLWVRAIQKSWQPCLFPWLFIPWYPLF